MKLPILLAHGHGLASYMVILSLCILAGLFTLVASGVFFSKRDAEGRRAGKRLLVAFAACVVVALFAPLFVQALDLP